LGTNSGGEALYRSRQGDEFIAPTCHLAYYWLVAKRVPMPRPHYRELLVSLPQHSGC
jgi:hypothetical protein